VQLQVLVRAGFCKKWLVDRLLADRVQNWSRVWYIISHNVAQQLSMRRHVRHMFIISRHYEPFYFWYLCYVHSFVLCCGIAKVSSSGICLICLIVESKTTNLSQNVLNWLTSDVPVYSKRNRSLIPARNFGCKQPSPGNPLHYVESVHFCSAYSATLGSGIVIQKWRNKTGNIHITYHWAVFT
jgi:hypothetical protein